MINRARKETPATTDNAPPEREPNFFFFLRNPERAQLYKYHINGLAAHTSPHYGLL